MRKTHEKLVKNPLEIVGKKTRSLPRTCSDPDVASLKKLDHVCDDSSRVFSLSVAWKNYCFCCRSANSNFLPDEQLKKGISDRIRNTFSTRKGAPKGSLFENDVEFGSMRVNSGGGGGGGGGGGSGSALNGSGRTTVSLRGIDFGQLELGELKRIVAVSLELVGELVKRSTRLLQRAIGDGDKDAEKQQQQVTYCFSCCFSCCFVCLI